jgi:hypothetical protein
MAAIFHAKSRSGKQKISGPPTVGEICWNKKIVAEKTQRRSGRFEE